MTRKEARLYLSVPVGAVILCPDTRSAALEHFHWSSCTRKGENPSVCFPGLILLVTLLLAPSMDSVTPSFLLFGCPPNSPSNHRPLPKDTHAQILLPFFPHRPWAAFGKFCASNLQAFLSSFINLAAKTSSSIYSTTSKASFSAAQVFYLPPASQHSSSCKPSTTLQVHPLASQYSILLIPSPLPTSPAPFLTTPFQTNSPYPCPYALLAVWLCPIHTH